MAPRLAMAERSQHPRLAPEPRQPIRDRWRSARAAPSAPRRAPAGDRAPGRPRPCRRGRPARQSRSARPSPPGASWSRGRRRAPRCCPRAPRPSPTPAPRRARGTPSAAPASRSTALQRREQRRIAAGGTPHEAVAFGRRQAQRLVDHVVGLRPAPQVAHEGPPPSSARSQARALNHSRCAVRSDTPSAAAVSSSDSPAK